MNSWEWLRGGGHESIHGSVLLAYCRARVRCHWTFVQYRAVAIFADTPEPFRRKISKGERA
jgi:hypothetical protein